MSHAEAVKRHLDAWNRRDLDALMELVTEEIEVDATRIAEGVYQGKEAVRAFWTEVFDASPFTVASPELHLAGDQVLVVASIRGIGSRSGAPFGQTVAFLYRMQRGAIERIGLYPDATAAQEDFEGQDCDA